MDILNMDTFAKHIAMGKPYAMATVRGNAQTPGVGGTVRFYPAGKGSQVVAEIFGLPANVLKNGKQESAGPFYAFHVHDGQSCAGADAAEPFPESGQHFNPGGQPHPYHAGDMPPLLGDGGYAYLSFYTSRFTPEQVAGRAVIIHQNADDFHTQPSGNSGTKLACGVIKKL